MKQQLLGALALSALVTAWAPTAFAVSESEKESIRSLSNTAADDFAKGNFDAARAKFERAYDLAKVPKLAVWLARSHEKLGHLADAQRLYREATALERNELWKGTTQQEAKKLAETELARLQPLVPRLTILLDGALPTEVTVSVDSVAITTEELTAEHPVNPGPHDIVATRGQEIVREQVVLAERGVGRVVLHFSQVPAVGQVEPTPAANQSVAPVLANTAEGSSTSGSPQRLIGWVGIGVGAAGVALGAISGAIAGHKYGELEPKCANHQCDPSDSSAVDSYTTFRTLSTVGFVAGGIVAAAGVTLLLTSPKSKAAPSVSLVLAPDHAFVRGAF